MTEKQDFIRGYIEKCASLGISDKQAALAVRKKIARIKTLRYLYKKAGIAGDLAKNLMLLSFVGAPAVAGAGGRILGTTIGKLKADTMPDEDEFQDQELTNEIATLARQMKERNDYKRKQLKEAPESASYRRMF